MRTNGVAERLCTGDASDREKFDAWAATVPHTIGNPLYHWTHSLNYAARLVLQVSCFLLRLLMEIWNQCNELLARYPRARHHAADECENGRHVTDDPIRLSGASCGRC